MLKSKKYQAFWYFIMFSITMSANADNSPDFLVVNSLVINSNEGSNVAYKCPEKSVLQTDGNYVLASANDIKANKASACSALGRWEIARIEGGGSMGGIGYKCKIFEDDTITTLGRSLCKLEGQSIPSQESFVKPKNSSQQSMLDRENNFILEFDGNDHKKINPAQEFDWNGSFTIEAWIKPDTLNGTQKVVSADGVKSFGLSNSRLHFISNDIQYETTEPLKLSEGRWYHIAVVLDENEDVSFYLDGYFLQKIPSSEITLTRMIEAELQISTRVSLISEIKVENAAILAKQKIAVAVKEKTGEITADEAKIKVSALEEEMRANEEYMVLVGEAVGEGITEGITGGEAEVMGAEEDARAKIKEAEKKIETAKKDVIARIKAIEEGAIAEIMEAENDAIAAVEKDAIAKIMEAENDAKARMTAITEKPLDEVEDQMLIIGSSYSTKGEHLTGALDEVRIWNVARTEKQIRHNMHGTLADKKNLITPYPDHVDKETNTQYAPRQVANDNSTIHYCDYVDEYFDILSHVKGSFLSSIYSDFKIWRQASNMLIDSKTLNADTSVNLKMALTREMKKAKADLYQWKLDVENTLYKCINYHALVIGIGEYGSYAKDLDKPAEEAQQIADILEYDYGFKSVKLLIDEEATQDSIEDAYTTLLENATKRDVVLIYYTGHGGGDGRHAYWEAAANNSQVQMEKLGIAMKESQAQKVLVVSDSCDFTANDLNDSVYMREKTNADPFSASIHPSYEDTIIRDLRSQSHVVISSGNEEAVDDGIFGQAFINALRSPLNHSEKKEFARYEMFTARKLFDQIKVAMNSANQNPKYSVSGNGDFIFRTTIKPTSMAMDK
ncbi:LamG-like jellyroll fold domain-containing protein [Candidatus Albibeggiatoa sp. nov. NOAA]|uniref:LamG-like jellyroll fold domain-containing protein n=1 Tax=Candidatus Albibeggiatoa sp. nov. NOAA TaxID=3162724 RepID=UPI0032F38777|nr:caspase family protein [Thiotrichaceae bacterium]